MSPCAQKIPGDLLLLDIFRLAVLLIVVLAYALFDVFNKRNVPNIFAYGTLALGVLLTLTYPLPTIGISLLVAAVIAVLGYITYRIGVLGAGDTFEFLFISLVMPLQAAPALITAPQFSSPFILSVFIATGYATIILTPAYYILRAKKKTGKIMVDKKGIPAAATLILAYIILIVALDYLSGNAFLVSVIMLLVAIPSSIILIFKNSIYEGMTQMVYPSELEPGDMIATNTMGRRDLSYFRKRSRHFERLATSQVIAETRRIRKKIPVYKNAIPLALFTLIGVIVSLLIGNVVLLLLA